MQKRLAEVKRSEKGGIGRKGESGRRLGSCRRKGLADGEDLTR